MNVKAHTYHNLIYQANFIVYFKSANSDDIYYTICAFIYEIKKLNLFLTMYDVHIYIVINGISITWQNSK